MNFSWSLFGFHEKTVNLIIILLLSFANNILGSCFERKLIHVDAKNAYGGRKDYTLNERSFMESFETLKGRCLFHIINSRGLDLPLRSLEHPIILSRYASLSVKYFSLANKTGQSQYERRTRIFPIEKFKNLTANHLKDCTVDANDMDNVECVEDFPAFDKTSRTKPWTCERHFHLFPPEYISGSVSHRWVPTTNMFEVNIPVAIKRHFWTRSFRIDEEGDTVRQNVQFYIIQRERFDILVVPFTQYSTIKSWSTRLTRITDTYGLTLITTTANHELLVMPTFFNLAREQTVREVYILCRHCKKCHSLHLTFLGYSGYLSYFKVRNSIDLVNLDLSNVVTRAYGPGKWLQIFLEAGNRLPRASKSHREFHNEIYLRSQDAGSMPYFFEMILLEKLLGNMTVVATMQPCRDLTISMDDPGHECDCRSMMNSIFSPMIQIAPSGKYVNAELYMHLSTLEFVSCGLPEKNSLSFGSLLWIFQTNVWLFIIFCLILLSLTTFVLHQFPFSEQEWQKIEQESRIKNVFTHYNRFWHQNLIPVGLTYLKGLLEQAGPLNPHLWKDSRSQVLYWLSLLMFMSLSTLYKNDNITELTLPRKPVPFDSFEMLMKHKFDVFTRSVYTVTGQSDNQDPLKSFGMFGPLTTFLVLASKRESEHVVGFNAISELLYFAGMETKYHDFSEAISPGSSRSNYAVDELPYETQLQMNHTRVIPNWLDYMVSKAGIEEHLNIIKRCNGTALLLPDVKALQLFHNMTGDGISNVFKSKRPLYTHRHGLRMLHWIPLKIIKNSGLLKQSGVLEWTREFFVNYMVRIKFTRSTKDVPVASNLNGQIVVVLMILPIGGVAAVLTFLAELYKFGSKFNNSVKRLVCKMKSVCKCKYVNVLKFVL